MTIPKEEDHSVYKRALITVHELESRIEQPNTAAAFLHGGIIRNFVRNGFKTELPKVKYSQGYAFHSKPGELKILGITRYVHEKDSIVTYHKFQVVPANQALVYAIEKSLLDSYRLIKGKYKGSYR